MHPPLVWLGEISYSLIMVHALVQILVLNRVVEHLHHSWTDRPVILTGAIAIVMARSIGIIAVTRRWIKEPWRRKLQAMLN